MDVAIPKLARRVLLPRLVLEPRRRAERELTTVVAACYLLEVSTRRMEKLVETLGITRLAKSQVSVMPRELDEQLADFRSRPLDAGPYTFVAADALVLKVREGLAGWSTCAPWWPPGVNVDEHREILGLQVTSAEDGAGWLTFFRDLIARGLSGVALVTSDARQGLVAAIGAAVPGASWLRRRTYYAANLMGHHAQGQFAAGADPVALDRCQPDADSVGAQYVRVLNALSWKLPKVADHLEERRADVLAFTAFPKKDLAPDLVQQPPGTTQPRDPPQVP
jgi:transposase-like protein